MKTRLYFVSNSSSSSFVCEICNHSEVGYDGPQSVGMVCCENDHTFCEEHLMEGAEYDYEVPEKFCPICNFIEPSYPDLMSYFFKTTNISKDTVFEEIKKINRRRKVLRDHEYVEFCLRNLNTTIDELLNKLRNEFSSYTEFRKSIRRY